MVWGDTHEGDDTRVKKGNRDSDSDSDEQKKVVSFLRRRNPGVTPQNWRLKKVARFFRKK